jgi:hypothetical protein
VENNLLNTTMVDNDCTCKKSGLTPGTPEVYVVPAPHMALHRVINDYQITVEVVNDVKRTEGDNDRTNRPRVIFG